MTAEINKNLESTNNQLQIKELDNSYKILSPKEKLRKGIEEDDQSLIEQTFIEGVKIGDIPYEINVEVFGNTLSRDKEGELLMNGIKISSIIPNNMKSFVSHYYIYTPNEAQVIVSNSSSGSSVDLLDMQGSKRSIYDTEISDHLHGYLKSIGSDEIVIKNGRGYEYGNIDKENNFTKVIKRSNALDMVVVGRDDTKKVITIEKNDNNVALFINGELYNGLPQDTMSRDAKLEKINENIFRVTFTDKTGKNFAYEINLQNDRIKPGSEDKIVTTVRSAHKKTLSILEAKNNEIEELKNVGENLQTTQAELKNTEKALQEAKNKNVLLQAQVDQLRKEAEEKRQATIKLNGENRQEFTRLNGIIESFKKIFEDERPSATGVLSKSIPLDPFNTWIVKLQKTLSGK